MDSFSGLRNNCARIQLAVPGTGPDEVVRRSALPRQMLELVVEGLDVAVDRDSASPLSERELARRAIDSALSLHSDR